MTFSYATSNGPPPTNGAIAVAGTDYTATMGTGTIPAGQTSVTIDVPVAGQSLYGLSKGFTFTLTGIDNATVTGGGTTLAASQTILNEVAEPTLSIAGYSATVPASGTITFPFVVTLSAPSSLATTVMYATADGTATAPTDYIATSGTLTIPAGSTTGTIDVTVNAATLTATSTFAVNLTSPVNATFPGGATTETATGTIEAFTPSSYAGYAFIDNQLLTNPASADTYSASTDVPLQGVVITLIGTSSVNNQSVGLQTTTSATGAYSFTGILPGTYYVTEQVPLGLSTPEAIVNDRVVGTSQYTITVPALGGVVSTNDNFAYSGIAQGYTGYTVGGDSQRGYLSSSPPVTGPIVVNYPTTTSSSSNAQFAAASGSSAPVETAAALASNVVQSGNTVTFTGTGGADSFSFTSGATDTVVFDGVTYHYNPSVVKDIVFNGTGSGSATLTDTTGLAAASLGPGYGTLGGAGYSVSVKNVTSLAVVGTGSDKATLLASAAHDQLFASGSYASLTDSNGLSVSIDDFAAATVESNAQGTLTKNVSAIDFALSEI